MRLPTLQRLTRFCAILASAIWMSLAIYQEFFDVDPTLYGFKNPEVEQRMQACSGTFLERYRCKEELIIEKGHADFLVWIEKVLWVFGPPAVLFGLLRLTSARPDDEIGPDENPPTDISRWRVR